MNGTCMAFFHSYETLQKKVNKLRHKEPISGFNGGFRFQNRAPE